MNKKRDSLSASKIPFFTKVQVSDELVAFLKLPSSQATFFEIYQQLCMYLDEAKCRKDSTITLTKTLQTMFDTTETTINNLRLYELIGLHCKEIK